MVKNVSAAAFPAATGDYVSPAMKVILFHPEGVLCSSVHGIENESFKIGEDSEYTI